MNKVTKLIIAGTIGILCAASAYASDSAQDFVTKAAIAGKFEIESSKIALNRSQNPQVKQFAQMMIDDHTRASDQLKATVQSNPNVQLPAGLDKKHQKMIDKLNSVDAKKFDKTYVDMQTKAHKEAVSLFKDYAHSGKDQSLKDFAANTLPVLQGHLDHVKQVKSNLP